MGFLFFGVLILGLAGSAVVVLLTAITLVALGRRLTGRHLRAFALAGVGGVLSVFTIAMFVSPTSGHAPTAEDYYRGLFPRFLMGLTPSGIALGFLPLIAMHGGDRSDESAE